MQLVKRSFLKPNLNNPRYASTDFEEELRLSIERLGWLLPLYCTSKGILLSGHARLRVSTDEMVPVIFVKTHLVTAFTLLFNSVHTHMCEAHYPRCRASDVFALNRYPILSARPVSLDVFSKKAHFARALHANFRIETPIVINEDGEILWGHHLVTNTSRATVVPNELSEYVRYALSLSASFELSPILNELRSNAWNAQISRGKPSRTLRFALRTPALLGNRPLDWGAGRLEDSAALRALGYSPIPFEPFCKGAHELCEGALSQLPTATSILCSYVLNSVPIEDWGHLLTLFASLKLPLFIYTLSGWRGNKCAIKIDDNTILTNVTGGHPKIQTYVTRQEFVERLSVFYDDVHVVARDDSLFARCTCPKPVCGADLERALLFEFSPPFPALLEEARPHFTGESSRPGVRKL